jgi:hypothetical protein
MRNEYQLAVALSDVFRAEPSTQARGAAFTHVFWGSRSRVPNCGEAARQHKLAHRHAGHLTGENLNAGRCG